MFIFTAFVVITRLYQIEANNTDFAELAKQKYFIDKTLFIRNFLEDKICDLDGTIDKVLVITGPPGCGKSAIADMLRRFLQHEVHPQHGQPSALEENTNYNLFCSAANPLKICEHETGKEFATNNLGRHPLIYLDFTPLKKSFSFKTFKQSLREIIAKAYSANEYLLSAVTPAQWKDRCNMTADQFRHYMNLNKDMTDEDVAKGFSNLTAALYKYFDKSVFLIIDNYDILYVNLMFEPSMEDHEDILHLMSSVNTNLFKYNVGLRKALVTGRLRIKDPAITFLWNNYTEHRWLDDHDYAKYYGFDKEEVDTLVRRYVQGRENINHTMHRIKYYYGGYYIQVQHTELYSIDSVVKFLENNLVLKCYRAHDIYFERTFVLFHIEQYEDLAKDLLFNKHFVTVDLTDPLNFKTILAVRNARVNLLYQSELQIDYFYTYMFDMGLLTPVPCSNRFISLVPLTIPNREAFLVFCRTLLVCYKRDHRYDFVDMKRFEVAFSAFKPDCSYEQYQDLFNALFFLTRHGGNNPQVERDLQLYFYVVLLKKYQSAQKESLAQFPVPVERFDRFLETVPSTFRTHVKNVYDKLNSDEEVEYPLARSDFMVINEHGVAIVMETRMHREPETKEGLRIDAMEALAQVYLTYRLAQDKPARMFREAKHHLYIGLGYCQEDINMTLMFHKPPFENLTMVEEYYLI